MSNELTKFVNSLQKKEHPLPPTVITIGNISFDLRLILVVVVSTIIPMLDYYGHTIMIHLLPKIGYVPLPLEAKAYDRLIFYLIIPAGIILFGFREPLHHFGFQWGDWRVGLKWTLIACATMTVILWGIARSASMQSYYGSRIPAHAGKIIYVVGVDLFGWEFIWRGFVLFALARVIGVGPAIWIQAIPFAFMHLGKPEIETLTTIFGGAAFGYVAWQSQSFVYPFFIHWYIAALTQLLVGGVFS